MSQDQRPGKVKLYSGSGGGNRPGGVRAVSGNGSPQRSAADGKAVTAAAGASATAEAGESGGAGQGWLLVFLFVLASAGGAALFMAFGPL